MRSSMRAPISWRIICESLGVGPEVVVGLCVERSLEMMVGLLGILKAGGAYLPLDPAYPPERLAFMLEDAARSGAAHPIGAARAAARASRRTVRLDADWPAIARQPTTAPANRLAAPATPPTSSTPRARPASPRAWWSRIAASPACGSPDRALQSSRRLAMCCSSPRSSFDAAISEICGAAASAARCLVLMPVTRAERGGDAAGAAGVAQHGVTHATLLSRLVD